MKVKATEFKRIETEINLEYPYYLYFQGEDSISSELVKVFPDYEIVLACDHLDVKILKRSFPQYREDQIKNNLTTENHFDTCYQEIVANMDLYKLGK